jgi:hypothetical protein
MNHSELKQKALENIMVKDVYEALEPEFSLLHEILKARQTPAVTRLESSLSSGKHSPSLSTLKKYANALNCHLEIKLVADS